MERVQMESLGNSVTMDGSLETGQIFWCSKEHGEHYSKNKIAKYVVTADKREPTVREAIMTRLQAPDQFADIGKPPAGPTETKPVQPEEAKDGDAKKFLDGAQDTQTNASAESSASGTVAPSSASQVAQASVDSKRASITNASVPRTLKGG